MLALVCLHPELITPFLSPYILEYLCLFSSFILAFTTSLSPHRRARWRARAMGPWRDAPERGSWLSIGLRRSEGPRRSVTPKHQDHGEREAMGPKAVPKR